MRKIIRLTESQLKDVIKKIINEQSQGISGSAMSFLQNPSNTLNKSLGVSNVPECFRYYRGKSNRMGNYRPSDGEIEDYVDRLGIYGKVPGTNIPIPYQGSDLQLMLQILQGSGTSDSAFGGNYKELGPIENRTFMMNGVLYPVVEDIRARFTQQKGESLWRALSKKMTDSKEDLAKKQEIIRQLVNAYQYWIDCVNRATT
jgi:hypothetical protein